ncbi:hypothetical protein Lepto7375DRAFT_8237 [Leptolyngbya sp. PCC 7375]|nr:hypothetical protein Lepto7375DRAFT_8237 [Leptolyngbya sp. PCC 7375]
MASENIDRLKDTIQEFVSAFNSLPISIGGSIGSKMNDLLPVVAEVEDEIATLEGKVEALEAQLASQTSTDAELDAIKESGTNAYIAVYSNKEEVTKASTEASNLLQSINASLELAQSADLASTSTAAAQEVADTATTVEINLQTNVSYVLDNLFQTIQDLALEFIQQPEQIQTKQNDKSIDEADKPETQLETLMDTLTTKMEAIRSDLASLGTASTTAAEYAAAAAVEYDNWNTVASLFEIETVEESLIDQTDIADSDLSTIDNWELVQQKFSLSEIA